MKIILKKIWIASESYHYHLSVYLKFQREGAVPFSLKAVLQESCKLTQSKKANNMETSLIDDLFQCVMQYFRNQATCRASPYI